MANKYLVLLEFLKNLNSHSVFEFKGKIKFITVTCDRLWTDSKFDLVYRTYLGILQLAKIFFSLKSDKTVVGI